METTDEELMTDRTEPAEEPVPKEAKPIPPDDTVREFEEFLMEIGLRI